jgi:beta-lactamase regulating signal transducer with metallopeptidase domain
MNALAQGAAHALAPFQGVAQALATYCVTALWLGAVIAALAALVVRCWKPLDAASRYAVWYVALVAVVLGPLATTVAVHYANRAPSDARIIATLRAPHELRVAPQLRAPANASAAARYPRIAVAPYAVDAVAALWLLAVLGGGARFAAGVAGLARLKRDALPLAPERRAPLALWNAHAGAARARRARLCVSDRIDVPVAVGLFDGMVVLPQHVLDAFEPADVDRFVLHELAHLERRDDWTTVFERVAQIVQFFNPVVHLIARRLDLEREIACDDRVVAETSDVRSYAVGLTRMAESAAWPLDALAAPAIFVTRKQLSLRVEELLARRRITAPRIAVAPAVLALVASLGVVSVAAVHGPAVDAGGTPAAQTGGFTRIQETKLIYLDRNGKKITVDAKHARVMMLHGDARVLEDLRELDGATPERMRALLKRLEADDLAHDPAPPRSPSHTR